jgi:hypothetical protein
MSTRRTFEWRDKEGNKHKVRGVGFEHEGVAYFIHRQQRFLYTVTHAEIGAKVFDIHLDKVDVEKARTRLVAFIDKMGRDEFYQGVEKARVST